MALIIKMTNDLTGSIYVNLIYVQGAMAIPELFFRPI